MAKAVKKNKGGRPAYKPTDEQRELVKAWFALGLTQEFVVKKLGIDAKTFTKHFQYEAEHGKDEIHAELGKMLITCARQAGSNKEYQASLFFYLKTRCGYSEKQILDHTSDGEKIGMGAIFAVSRHRIVNDENTNP